MKVEIDQSGKIGDTKVPTVLAFSNGKRSAILIPATVKRECLLSLREQGIAGKTIYMKLFAVGLYLLLKDHIHRFSQNYRRPGISGQERRNQTLPDEPAESRWVFL